MNTISILLRRVLLLAVILATCVGASGKAVKVEAPSKPLTIRQARKAMAESLQAIAIASSYVSVQEIKFLPDRITFKFLLKNGSFRERVIELSHLNKLEVRSKGVTWNETEGSTWSGNRLYVFKTEAEATKYADALITLKLTAGASGSGETDLATFQAAARAWIAASPKPEMPREARTYRLLAEEAFRQKDYRAALDAYEEALDRFSTWPEGQYNAAILAAELKDYSSAAHHMRCYLALSPEAKDAAAAEDKLLLWEHKAKQ